MGCCESVEDDSVSSSESGDRNQAAKPPGQQQALRKQEFSPEPTEVICGGLKLRYAYLSQRGYYPDDPHKPNQDAFYFADKFANQASDAFFAVYDGHGRDGD